MNYLMLSVSSSVSSLHPQENCLLSKMLFYKIHTEFRRVSSRVLPPPPASKQLPSVATRSIVRSYKLNVHSMSDYSTWTEWWFVTSQANSKCKLALHSDHGRSKESTGYDVSTAEGLRINTRWAGVTPRGIWWGCRTRKHMPFFYVHQVPYAKRSSSCQLKWRDFMLQWIICRGHWPKSTKR